MAIRKVLSSAYGQLVDGAFSQSRGASALGLKTGMCGTVECLATDEAGSEYSLVNVPSSAILLPGSAIRTNAWGFAQAVIGVDGDTDAFAVNADGTVSYYQTQDGLMSRVTGSENPVDELTGQSDIMFVDLDGDGDLDLVLKDDLGLTNYLENL